MARSIDVVCIQGLLHEVERPDLVIDEVYRVLRPGGKVIAVAPAKMDAKFWQDRFFPWRRWWTGSRQRHDRRQRRPAFSSTTFRDSRIT